MEHCDNKMTKHRLICIFLIVFLSMVIVQLFHPIKDVGFSTWLIKSLQIMAGMLVFTVYSFIDGFIGQAFFIILIGLGLPILLLAVHIKKNSILALYASAFVWILGGFATVIAAAT